MYNHKEIEKKWQKYWEENKTFKIENDFSKPKYYCLDMFPYPSGAGLHVGHPEGMTANDIIARYKNANGFNVLHPMGWDAFGLPAENYAIKTGTHPRITTDQNINNFRAQIKALGFSYDWDREIDTTDPEYYKWTQWIFLKLFEKGLAYEQDLPINYCPSCQTGLANEEVLNDFTCERCGEKVEKKKIRQWVLAITKYADRLEKDVDKLDWPEGIKEMQKNWIGKSQGCEFEMKVIKNSVEIGNISVYTTRIDTVFGMTYAVLAPDHKDVNNFVSPEQKEICEKYIEGASKKSDQDRIQEDKEKTGVFTGSYVINPFNNKKVPLWIADYVLGNYGTGAVMAVPAHDTRDFDFAKKYNLEIKYIIAEKEPEIKSSKFGNNKDINEFTLVDLGKSVYFIPKNIKKAQIKLGILVNSGKFDGLESKEAQVKMVEYAEKQGFGKKKINYKLRDWLFSRQRYWGEPIPLIHLEKSDIRGLKRITSFSDNMEKDTAYVLKEKSDKNSDKRTLCSKGKVKSLVINGKIISKIYDGIYTDIICDYKLPLELPEVEDFAPSGDGKSPLAKVDNFVNISLADNLKGKRETNTMPQWGGSCWYYLRYMDPNNNKRLVDPKIEKYWGQVDSYVGGAEHAVLHLLYARFWHKFLFDIGVVSNDEPFYKLRNQGLILAHAYQRKNGGLLANDLVEEKNGLYYEISSGEEVNRIVSKMSKSLKNVVNPDDIIKEYGADSLRLYEMYMAEFKDTAPWNTKNIIGVYRFLEKVERLFGIPHPNPLPQGIPLLSKAQFTLIPKGEGITPKISKEDDIFTEKLLHKTIKKVEEDIEDYKFNTAIASLMILVNNGLPKAKELQKKWKKTFLILLHPFAPHLSEELWEQINNPSPVGDNHKPSQPSLKSKGRSNSIFFAKWPKYDKKLVIDDEIKIAVQVLGKVRGTIEISKNEEKDSVLDKAKQEKNVSKWLEGKTLIKEIYVPGKIINFVVK